MQIAYLFFPIFLNKYHDFTDQGFGRINTEFHLLFYKRSDYLFRWVQILILLPNS